MKKLSLRSQYRKNLLSLHLLTISVISIIEIIAYIIFLKNPTFIERTVNEFLNFNVVVPIITNYLAHIGARIIINNKKISNAVKDGVIVYAAFITSMCISILHREYLLVFCSFVFPIVLSGFFNNKKLLNSLIFCTSASLTVSTALVLTENTINTTLIINIVVAFVFVIISYFSSLLAIIFSHESFTEIKNQSRENSYLQEQIQLDSMTGLYNHQVFTTDFVSIVKKYKTPETSFCLAIIDIDDFKQVNDTHGHDYGDKVIMMLTNSLRKHCTPEDKIYRYGGEEFAIIFPSPNINECIAKIDKMKLSFSLASCSLLETPLTFSCGIDLFDGNTTAEGFFEHVDKLLYHAKQTGKSKIVSKKN